VRGAGRSDAGSFARPAMATASARREAMGTERERGRARDESEHSASPLDEATHRRSEGLRLSMVTTRQGGGGAMRAWPPRPEHMSVVQTLCRVRVVCLCV
jgi:hypothetical protein